MKLIERHDIGKGYDEYHGKGSIGIELQDNSGKLLGALTICAGEPEDAVFFRDLDGAYSIAKLLKIAYEAGKNGEDYNYEFIDESEEENECQS